MLTFSSYKSRLKEVKENIDLIKKVLTILDWKIAKETEDRLECTTSISFSSFGENITISIFKDNINITIESKVKITVADSGNGNLLIKNFIEELQRQE
jgi:hypothetical protein